VTISQGRDIYLTQTDITSIYQDLTFRLRGAGVQDFVSHVEPNCTRLAKKSVEVWIGPGDAPVDIPIFRYFGDVE
jgi:hypothetical protein